MAIAGAIKNVSPTKNGISRTVGLAFSGTYTTSGDTFDLTALTNPNYIAGALQFGALPVRVTIDNQPEGYSLEWIPGTTLKNGKIQAYSASGTQCTGGAAYPFAADTDVTLTFEVPALL